MATTAMTFTKAVRKRAKLRLGISGVAGSGKTTAALEIATGLIGTSGGRIAVIDTERRSADLYAGLYDFDSMELNPPYAPERFIEAIQAAEAAGYAVCIAGKEGFALEKKYGPATAGMLLYMKSTPDERIPNFYTTNELAMADLKARAAKQTGRA